MKNKPLYYKSISGVELNGLTASGYLASFNNKDADGDIILKGAFAKSINERGVNSNTPRKIAYLYQHDMNKPIGKFTTLIEDTKGLYFEAKLDDIQLSRDVAKQYESGTLNQHSIGFRYINDKIEKSTNDDAWIVKEVDLFEGSVVTMGANDLTPFMGFKSSELNDMAEQLRKETEAFLKHIPYEEQFKIRQLISKYMALGEIEPIDKVTQEIIKPSEVKKVDWNYIISNLKLD